MFGDIAISTALAILTITMAYLGVHVTLHPASDSPRRQFWFKTAFVACAVSAVVLVVCQSIRNGESQNDLRQSISTLRADLHNTQQALVDARVKLDDFRRESARAGLDIKQSVARSGNEVAGALRGLSGALPPPDRVLSPNQEQTVIRSVRRFHPRCIVIATANDAESVRFAQQLRTMLEHAGWDFNGNLSLPLASYNGVLEGVSIVGDTSLRRETTALRQALNACGVAATTDDIPGSFTINVRVGSKRLK